MSSVLILGGTGMLGHTLWRAARERGPTQATVRAQTSDTPGAHPAGAIAGVRAEAPDTVEQAIQDARPDVVVNCIGVVKQAEVARDPAWMVQINALFPHQLAAACQARGIRLIHISTDCVFSGADGGYRENDIPSPVDLYGSSKLAGEPSGSHVLNLRTSMIGWELGGRRQGLLEWFVSRRGGQASGYTRAVFSGPTAPVLSRLILELVDNQPALSGTWHVAAPPIAKHDLLVAVREALGLEVEIIPDASVVIDRSLDGSALTQATGWRSPSWEEMIAELAAGARSDVVGERLAGR